VKPAVKSRSLFQLRLRKFRTLKRGYYSFLFLTALYACSFLLPFFMSDRALVVQYDGKKYYPALKSYLHETFGFYEKLGFFKDQVYLAKDFGQPPYQSIDYRQLKAKFESRETLKNLIRRQRDLNEKSDAVHLTEDYLWLRAAEQQSALARDLIAFKPAVENTHDDAAPKVSEAVLAASDAASALCIPRYDDVATQQKTVLEKLTELEKMVEEAPDLKGNYVVMPVFPYSPTESFSDSEDHPNPPHPPSRKHWMGTDDRGRDVLVRLAYGFRVSLSFALLVTVIEYVIGTMIGATLGYFGRWVDTLGVRFVEIWSSIPFLYTIMILADRVGKSFPLLVVLMAAFAWIGIAYYVRGEYLREKAKDYVAAARAIGEGELSIMFRHILPNALTPIIAFAPFAIVGNITALLALDYLGFGLPTETPSWGELIGQGKSQLTQWHVVTFPLLAIFFTLQLIVFIGEAVREAFDPKVFSKLQ
jgi:microcin C transport system permease protein